MHLESTARAYRRYQSLSDYILPLTGLLASARWWVMAFALGLTVITGIDYVYRALTLRRTSARAMAAAAARRAAGPSGTGEARSDTAA